MTGSFETRRWFGVAAFAAVLAAEFLGLMMFGVVANNSWLSVLTVLSIPVAATVGVVGVRHLWQPVLRGFVRRHPWLTGASVLVVGPLTFMELVILFALTAMGGEGGLAPQPWALAVSMLATPLGVVVGIKLYDRRIASQREIAARADYEHNALMSGDIRTGVYGRYQPPDLQHMGCS